MLSLNPKHKLFRHYKYQIVTILIRIFRLKTLLPQLYVLIEITISRENLPSSQITQGTQTLNNLIRCKNTSN